MKIILIIMTLLSLQTKAGDKVGNGGGLWTCENISKILEQGILVDLYEAQEEFGLVIIHSNESDPFRIVAERSEFLRLNVPAYSAVLNKYLSETFSKIRFVNSELVVIEDSLYRIRPPRSSCSTPWSYTQFANFTDFDQVLIRSDLWTHANVSKIDKAALIWHEVVYRWLRNEFNDQDSIRARQIVGYIFSNLSGVEISNHINKVLNSKLPTPSPSPVPNPFPSPNPPPVSEWFCQIRNTLNSIYFSDSGSNQLMAKTRVLQKCQSAQGGFHCDETSLKCDEMSSFVNKFFCKNKNSLTGKIFSAEGRSLLQAEFNARNACQRDGYEFHCETDVICQ